MVFPAFPRHQIGLPGLTPFPFPGKAPQRPGPFPTSGGRPRPGGEFPFVQLPEGPVAGTNPPFPDPGFPPLRPGAPSPIGPPLLPGTEGGGGDSPFPGLQDDFIKELFGQQPELVFFGALNEQSQDFTPIQRQFFPTQFGNVQNRFFGQLGNLIQGGTALGDLPTFQDFVGDIDFQDEFRRLAPSLRPGSSQARFRPPTQFRF